MAAIVEALRKAVGDGRILTDGDTLWERRHDYWVLSQLDDLQGRPAPKPACVARPESTAEVVAIVNACRESGTPVIPFGLGSGVCGGVIATPDCVMLDLGGMNRTRRIDVDNLVATFEAGVCGIDAERQVRRRGLTIGHWPQSVEISTVGGWVATRSAGQFSTAYGNIEDIILGLEVVLPSGEVLQTRVAPRASTGPDLRHVFMGSEGTLGVITAVTFSLRWIPEERTFSAFYAKDMETGLEAERVIVQAGWRPPVVRLYDSTEAHRLFPDEARGDDALLLLLHEGPGPMVEAEVEGVAALMQELGCEQAPPKAVERWLHERNHVPGFEPFLKNGVILDTIEVSASWDRIGKIYRNVVASLSEVENMLTASAHSSHSYRSGTNLYFTFAARPDEPERMAEVYRDCWRRTLDATLAGGGSVAHHHGIGRLRRDWMPKELGAAGVAVLRGMKQALDPTGFMNPGVLLPDA